MTDRTSSLVVILEKETRVDDVEKLMDAIGQLRGVLSVKLNVSDYTHIAAREQVRREISDALWCVLSGDGK